MSTCSIIIPSYDQAPLISQCLDALLVSSPLSVDIEIIVVDDGSIDVTPQLLACYGDRIRVVTHRRNKGFAAACNNGASLASGNYLVFLNNDTIPKDGWLDALIHYADCHPEAAAVGSKLLFPNETIQHAGVVICHDRNPHHLYAGFPADHPAVNKSRRFQIVTAACVLIRRQLFEEIGGFDIAFQNGCEDIDLCLRFGERGYEVHYCHESVLYHLESASREGHAKKDQYNLQLYRTRWAHRVEPDDLYYYREDGLLGVSFAGGYPIQMTISPLLAVLDRGKYDREVDQLLCIRSRQVFALLKETIRLTRYIQDATLRQTLGKQIGLQEDLLGLREEIEAALRDTPKFQRAFEKLSTIQLGRLGDRADASSSSEAELRAMLLDAHTQLLRRDEELQATVYDLQAALAKVLSQDLRVATHPASAPLTPNETLGYQQLLHHIREVVRRTLPQDSIIVVVSKGDEDLTKLNGRTVWHFPRTENGTYSGAHPRDSNEAITHLEELRAKGADFLLLPKTAFWWLDYYEEFRQYVDASFQAISRNEHCIIYQLSDRTPYTV